MLNCYTSTHAFVLMQGQDDIDLEMNMNGPNSNTEDDKFDDIVCIFFIRSLIISPRRGLFC